MAIKAGILKLAYHSIAIVAAKALSKCDTKLIKSNFGMKERDGNSTSLRNILTNEFLFRHIWTQSSVKLHWLSAQSSVSRNWLHPKDTKKPHMKSWNTRTSNNRTHTHLHMANTTPTKMVLANTTEASTNTMNWWWKIRYSETICLNTINFVQLIDSTDKEERHKMEEDEGEG